MRPLNRRGESKVDLLLLFSVLVVGLLIVAWWKLPEVQRGVRLVADQLEERFKKR